LKIFYNNKYINPLINTFLFRENVKTKSLPFQKTAVNLYTDAEIMSQNEENATVYLSENLEVNDSETKHR
jgi:hypothetical protein